MKKQKILIESELVINGGVENMLQNLADYLSKKEKGTKYAVTVAACPRNKQDFQAAFSPNIRCIYREKIRKDCKKFTLAWLMDKIVCRLHDFFVNIYLNLVNYDVSIAITTGRIMKRNSLLRAKKKYGWVHMDYSAAALWEVAGAYASREEEKKCMQRYDKIVCVSQTVKNSLIKVFGDPGNLCVKYNPINANGIREMAQAVCPLQKTPQKFLIVSVGRLVPEKQYLLLLQICRNLSKENDFEVWILGEGPDRDRLEAYIAQEHLTFVKLLGNQKNPYAYLRQADLFVSCSATESYGLAIQEALVLGVPVAAVRCEGIEEAFDPRFGVLTNNSIEEMENAVRELIRDREKLRKYQENIKKYYPTAELYEKRMEDICSMWENDHENP